MRADAAVEPGMNLRVIMPRGDAATACKWADATGPFKIGLGAERAGLHTRCKESPAITHAKPVAGKTSGPAAGGARRHVPPEAQLVTGGRCSCAELDQRIRHAAASKIGGQPGTRRAPRALEARIDSSLPRGHGAAHAPVATYSLMPQPMVLQTVTPPVGPSSLTCDGAACSACPSLPVPCMSRKGGKPDA